jgi:ATP-dependent Clp protease ATP-binding subunit ClpA
MTSNAGADFIQDAVRSGKDVAVIKEGLLREHLRGVFRPEFLNRFDDTVVFSPLTVENTVAIARLMLDKVARRLKDKGIDLRVTEEAVWELAQAGYDPSFGARPLRRVIQDRVDNPIAEIILRRDAKRRDTIVVDAHGQVYVERAQGF